MVARRLQFLRLRYLLWLTVPLLLLWWALRTIPLREVWTVLTRLGLLQILALIAANVVVLLLFSGRWWLILRAQGYSIPYLTLVGYRLAAFGVSYFTPGPQFGGEPLQVYLVGRRHHVPRSAAISAVTLDKSLELVPNFAFLSLGVVTILQWQVFPGMVGKQAMFFALVLLVLSGGFLLAIWAGQHPVSRLWQLGASIRIKPNHQSSSIPQRVYQTIKESEEQATYFCHNHPLTIGLAWLISVISWASIIGEYWLALHLLGLSLTPGQVVGALTAARIAFLLPIPGGLGVLEASQVLALNALGLNPAVGISLSLLIRVRDVALGGLGLWWGGIALVDGPNMPVAGQQRVKR
jgi:uncharacterized protein (TIRG00374 family)